MKKFFSFICALAIVISASALPQLNLTRHAASQIPNELRKTSPVEKESKAAKMHRAPQAKADAALASGTYYTSGGTFYAYTSSGWVDATSYMPSITVTVSGNNVSIAGLAYFFPNGTISGTMNGNTITFPNGQLIGTDNYGDEFLVGSNDGQTVCDIVFTYDPATQTLTSSTAIIAESASTSELNVYCYWYNAAFSANEPVAPEVIDVPENLQTETYKFEGHDSYYNTDTTFQVQVGFDGNNVYFQGLSLYLPEGWVVGTLSDGVVTIPETYLGVFESIYGNYDITFSGADFTYDAATNTFTCTEYTTFTTGYILDEWENIVITKMNEFAATPADPQIIKFAVADVQYPYVSYLIPLKDTADADLLGDKMSYKFYIEKESVVSPLVLTTDLYTMIENDMIEIPYTFSDDYDIYNNGLYLNQSEEEIRTWDKIGLQSIYYGGGETHASNIVWFDVQAYWAEVDGQTGIENIQLNEKMQKVVVDGVLYILRDNKLYNLQGAQVR